MPHLLETLLIERFADRSDPAIPSCRWADQIGAGAGLGHRLTAELGDGFVVKHGSLRH